MSRLRIDYPHYVATPPSLGKGSETLSAVLLKSLLVGGWFLVLFGAERLLPASPRVGGWRRIGRNAGLWAINALASPLIVLPISSYAASHPLWQLPDWSAGGARPWLVLATDLLSLDLFLYWWHRANHEVPFLWRWHQVHHLDQFLDTSSAVRFHVGEVVMSALARAVVIVVLAIPFATVLLFESLVLIAAIFHHSNLRLRHRFEHSLSRFVITPSLHWMHHHAVRRDTDSTYGTILSLWDRLFRSTAGGRRRPDMAIGLEGRDDLALPLLLIAPLRPAGRD